MKPKYLVLGPAGMGYFTILGFIHNNEKVLDDIQEISGASAGAILALLLGLNMKCVDILERSMLADIKSVTKFNVKSLLNTFGLISHDKLRSHIVDICGCDPTFSELDKKVYISAYCLNTHKTVYFNRDTHPNVKVIDAVCMSITVPMLFESLTLDGYSYVDGGLIEKTPCQPFLSKNPNEVLSVQIRFDDDIDDTRISGLKRYIETVICALLMNRITYDDIIKPYMIDIGSINAFDFSMDYHEKLDLYLLGTKHSLTIHE
jgi:predicted acylesterase/phospholipase RssA